MTLLLHQTLSATGYSRLSSPALAANVIWNLATNSLMAVALVVS